MKTKLFKSLIFLLVMVIMLGSCKKEAGPAGPAGPKGDVGAKGDPGDKGSTGDKGATGTANVIYSDWLPIPTQDNESAPYRKIFSFSVPGITREILDKGVIYAYIKLSDSDPFKGIYPLPHVIFGSVGASSVNGSYSTFILPQVGYLGLYQSWLTSGIIPSDFANSNKIYGAFTHIRYVIVPGSVRANTTSVNFNDYQTVKAYFKLGE
ncbi:hypothetical protein D9M68_425180 [compost metagenome]